ELVLQDKLNKAQMEVDALKRELELKNEMLARTRNNMSLQKDRITELEQLIELQTKDRLDLTSDMSRQYKTMQAELIAKVNILQRENLDLKTRLTHLQTQHVDEIQQLEEMQSQKETIIEEQNLKMAYMTSEFEGMLSETLSKMTKKIELVTQRWKETDQVVISDSNMRRLEDFNLTRIALGNIHPEPISN
ncbi:hypothetical protein EDD86DRAFT_188568, partial [Gorgonomyces haynaldii]